MKKWVQKRQDKNKMDVVRKYADILVESGKAVGKQAICRATIARKQKGQDTQIPSSANTDSAIERTVMYECGWSTICKWVRPMKGIITSTHTNAHTHTHTHTLAHSNTRKRIIPFRIVSRDCHVVLYRHVYHSWLASLPRQPRTPDTYHRTHPHSRQLLSQLTHSRMNLCTSLLSSMTTTTTTTRKRPRTISPLEKACTSVLTIAAPAVAASPVENKSRPDELFATRTPIDNALAQIDIGLGLACSSTSTLPTILPTTLANISIEDELDAVLATMREEREKLSISEPIPEDTASCVSGSGALGQRSAIKAEGTSPAMDVLHELHALDSRTSTTLVSPPLVKSLYKQRRRRWKTVKREKQKRNIIAQLTSKLPCTCVDETKRDASAREVRYRGKSRTANLKISECTA